MVSRIITYLAVFGVFVGLTLGGLYGYAAHVWKSPVQIEDQVVEIREGTAAMSVFRLMQRKGVVPENDWIYIWFRLKGFDGIKSGEYVWAKGRSPAQMWASMTRGEVLYHSVTIIEGWNTYEILAYLSGLDFLDFDIKSSDPRLLAEELQLESDSSEGFIAPDTYYVHRGTKASTLLNRSVVRMAQWLDQAWQGRDITIPIDSPYDLLIMASIVEKETGSVEERPTIASVFINRINEGMRLQTDPTVIYGIGPSFNGDITRRDLRTHTAWNTYVIDGLPPTPIASPSYDALLAVARPADSPYFYFVAQGDGKHYFSETLAEHNAAVRRYLLEVKE